VSDATDHARTAVRVLFNDAAEKALRELGAAKRTRSRTNAARHLAAAAVYGAVAAATGAASAVLPSGS